MTVNLQLLIPTFLIAFMTTFILTPIFKKLAYRMDICDRPCDRKIHKVITPLLGGLALLLGVYSSAIAHLPFNETLIAMLVGGTLIVCLGVSDDIWELSAITKLIGQIIVAIITVKMGILCSFVSNPFSEGVLYLGSFAFPFSVLWIISVINIFNLIDGLDGLAAGIAAISSMFLALFALSTGQVEAALLAIALCGANIGFLRYNFPPAQIFMGDAGSMFIGYMLGVISIIGGLKSTVAFSLAAPMLILAIPITDTVYAIIRRLKSKQAIFKPDKEHLHHKLLQSGFSPKQIITLMYGVTICCGTVALILLKIFH